jgi:predicted CoA-binding protein
MQKAGYRILPVNPKLSSVLGETCRPDLGRVEEDVDIVNLFRASGNIPDHVDEILALEPRPRAVWMQLGIHDGPSAQRLREAGILVIQDRCIMVDHRRLLGDRN